MHLLSVAKKFLFIFKISLLTEKVKDAFSQDGEKMMIRYLKMIVDEILELRHLEFSVLIHSKLN